MTIYSNKLCVAQGMLEVVVEGHSIDKFLEIRTLPTVQISMGLSVSVDEFYNVRPNPLYHRDD